MRLLLDTHIALWAITDHPKLPDRARRLIEDEDNPVFVSVVSLWEIAVKYPLSRQGAGAMPLSANQALTEFRAAGYPLLGVTPDHVLELERLPLLHGDPFDRMLVAQAQAEPLRLVTRDSKLAPYGEAILSV